MDEDPRGTREGHPGRRKAGAFHAVPAQALRAGAERQPQKQRRVIERPSSCKTRAGFSARRGPRTALPVARREPWLADEDSGALQHAAG